MPIKKTFFVFCILMLFTFYVKAQSSTTKVATARIIEANLIRTSAILVVYETGESETILLNKLETFVKEEKAYAALIENQKIINQFLEKMSSRGYELKTMTTAGEAYFSFFLVFEKKP